jgi:hypothetical protein
VKERGACGRCHDDAAADDTAVDDVALGKQNERREQRQRAIILFITTMIRNL